jgi:hypothetical protein
MLWFDLIGVMSDGQPSLSRDRSSPKGSVPLALTCLAEAIFVELVNRNPEAFLSVAKLTGA